jgi:hypothetical protein
VSDTGPAFGADLGPQITRNGELVVAVGEDDRGRWRVMIGLRMRTAAAAGELASADFDPADVGEIIEGLSAAIAEARRLAG